MIDMPMQRFAVSTSQSSWKITLNNSKNHDGVNALLFAGFRTRFNNFLGVPPVSGNHTASSCPPTYPIEVITALRFLCHWLSDQLLSGPGKLSQMFLRLVVKLPAATTTTQTNASARGRLKRCWSLLFVASKTLSNYCTFVARIKVWRNFPGPRFRKPMTQKPQNFNLPRFFSTSMMWTSLLCKGSMNGFTNHGDEAVGVWMG